MVQGRHSEMPAHLTPTEKKKIHMTCNYETANPQNTPKFTPKWEKNEYNEISAPSLFWGPHKHTPKHFVLYTVTLFGPSCPAGPTMSI